MYDKIFWYVIMNPRYWVRPPVRSQLHVVLMKMLRFGLECNPIRPLYILRRIEKVKVSAGPWKPLNLLEVKHVFFKSTCSMQNYFLIQKMQLLEVTMYDSSSFIILLLQSTEEKNRTTTPSPRRRLAEISGSSLPAWTACTSLSTAPPKHSSTVRSHIHKQRRRGSKHKLNI